MSCPYADKSHAQVGGTSNQTDSEQINYSDYLQLDKLLNCQRSLSLQRTGKLAPDEHLFVITHQAYELWFKEIIYEIDSITNIFLSSKHGLNEEKTLHVISLFKRVLAIFKLLNDQFQCLETMTPFGFMEFRDYISPASGFQSAQFRIIENKLGVSRNVKSRATEKKLRELQQGMEEQPSLLQIVQLWLSRTPGLEEDGFDFWGKFKSKVYEWLGTLRTEADCKSYANQDEVCNGYSDCFRSQTDETVKAEMLRNLKTTTETFESIFIEERHNQLVARGERRFSHKAFQGALMIYFYRIAKYLDNCKTDRYSAIYKHEIEIDYNQPRFHQPFQILELLVEIDSLIIKWRYNHLLLAQRMIGTRTGTGGSSGYQYLRSTISDRYRVFIDLLHMSNFLVPLEFIPPLTRGMRTVLRRVNKSYSESDSATWTESSDEETAELSL